MWTSPSFLSATAEKILAPPTGLKHFHLGFKDIFADQLWVHFIQRAFDCSRYGKGQQCAKRWGYKVLETASQLSPRFKALYKFGAVKLTVLLDDHKGAAELFDRGTLEYPEDWLIHYRASYVYMQELKNYEKAAYHLEVAGQNGAPLWTKSLASKMYSKAGKQELSYRTLMDLYKEAPLGQWRDSLEKRLLKLHVQLESHFKKDS